MLFSLRHRCAQLISHMGTLRVCDLPPVYKHMVHMGCCVMAYKIQQYQRVAPAACRLRNRTPTGPQFRVERYLRGSFTPAARWAVRSNNPRPNYGCLSFKQCVTFDQVKPQHYGFVLRRSFLFTSAFSTAYRGEIPIPSRGTKLHWNGTRNISTPLSFSLALSYL